MCILVECMPQWLPLDVGTGIVKGGGAQVGPQLNNFDQVSSDDLMTRWGGYVWGVGQGVCLGGSPG